MSARQTVVLYLLSACFFFAIDLAWLGVAARSFYHRHLGAFLAERVNWPAALLFYALYIGGIVLFVLTPAFKQGDSLTRTALMGAALGLFAYGTYDLTNLALLRGWPSVVVWVDMAWGALLTGTVSALALWTARLLLRS